MRRPQIDDMVRLTCDVPEYGLTRGAIGTIRSTWFAPILAFEVEFLEPGETEHTRVMLDADQVEVEASLFLAPDLAEEPAFTLG